LSEAPRKKWRRRCFRKLTSQLWVSWNHVDPPRIKRIRHSFLVLVRTALRSCSPKPLLAYLYLPWAAQNRVGQTWIYADTSEWNTFWFVVLTREWWGLINPPQTFNGWWEALKELFRQQADQITAVGVTAGMIGEQPMTFSLGTPAAADNDSIDTDIDADGAAGTVTAAQALPTVTDNYAKANRNADKLEALQEWIRAQIAATNSP